MEVGAPLAALWGVRSARAANPALLPAHPLPPASVAQLVRADGYSGISGATLTLSAWDGDTSAWVASVATATTDSRGYANVSLYPTDLLADAAVSRLASSYKASGWGASLSR